MPEEVNPSTVSPAFGFLREGWRELGRKWERRKLQNQLQGQGRERDEALGLLGQRAWQEKIDLTAFPDLRDQLGRLDQRIGELSVTTKNQEAEKAALEQRRAAEVARFDGQRRVVEESKQPADAAVQAARERHGARARAVQQMEARVSTLDGELAAVAQQMAALAASTSPERPVQMAEAQARQQQLLAEKARVAGELSQAKLEIPGSAADLNRLVAESQRFADQIAQIETARKAALAETDAALERVRGQLQVSQQQASAVQQERGGRFAALGLALYSQKAAPAPLAGQVQQVAALDQGRAATQAALQASLAQSQAMPRSTMLKFFAFVLLVPSLMFAAAVGMYSGWNQLQSSTDNERRVGSVTKKRCEPLQKACNRLRNWKDCVQSQLNDLTNDIVSTQAQLDAESAGRSATPEQMAIWQPQYLLLRQQVLELIPFVANLQAEVGASVASAMADCALLPGPEDEAQCRAAAQRVEDALKKIREKLDRDLDARLTVFNSVAQGQGAAWTSMSILSAKLQVRQTLIKQCSL